MQKKIVVVVKDGTVQAVFTDDPYDDVEIIDFGSNTMDEEKIGVLQDRVNTISQHLIDHLA